MGIEKEIIKVLIDARRRGIKVNSILAGDKEMSEMNTFLKKMNEIKGALVFEMDFGIENTDKHSIRVFKVNEENFLSAAYVIDQKEPAIKVSDLVK